MTGADMRTLRESLYMDVITFGVALGYPGVGANVSRRVRRLEKMVELPDAAVRRVEELKRRLADEVRT